MNASLLSVLMLCSFFLKLQSQEFIITKETLTGKSNHLKSENNYLLPEVATAFYKMKTAAIDAGIQIQLVSGYRNFDRQKAIFLSKYKKYIQQGLTKDAALKKIITYSTIPGTSRHHWGTDLDIIQKVKNTPKNLLVAKNYQSEGPFCEMKEWLDANASKFGFQLVYTDDKSRSGFHYEPWHYTYAPVSKILLQQFLLSNKNNQIYPIIKNAGIPIDKQFYDNYIETHIKGVHPALISQ